MLNELGQLSDKDLSRGYWFVTHRAFLIRILEVVIGIVAFVTLLYSAWQTVDWLTSRKAEEEALRTLVQSGTDIQALLARNTPQGLEVGTATALPLGGGRYDMVAQINNPNLRWAIQKVDYTFTTAAGEQASGSSFFLPLEDKLVMVLGVSLASSPGNVSVALSNTNWQRIRDIAKLSLPQFSISNQQLEVLPASDGGLSTTRLTFDLTNESVSNFWEVGVKVLLTVGNTPQAVGYQVAQNVASQIPVRLQFFWPGQEVHSDGVVVKPEVNVLDSSVFKAR